MKKGFNALSFILFLCLLCSCSDGRISDRLTFAESFLPLQRDSALSILNSINVTELKGKSMNARHALLKLQALEGYDYDWEVPDSSDGYFYARPMMDSLTDVVTHFYIDRAKGSEADRMKAYYYAGVKLQYDSIYPGAIQNLNHSLDMARELQDTLWIGKNAIWLADIYCSNMHTGEGLKYSLLAHDAFSALGIQPFLNLSFVYLSQAYYNNDDMQTSIDICNTLLDSAYKAHDIRFELIARKKLGGLYNYIDEYDKSYHYLNELFKEGKADLKDKIFLSQVLTELGKESEIAKLDLPDIDEVTNRSDVYLLLSYLIENAVKNENFESAFQNTFLLMNINDDYWQKTLKRNLLLGVDDMREAENQAHKIQIKNRRNNLIIIIAFSCLIILSLSYILIKRVKKHSKRELEYRNMLDSMESMNKRLEEDKLRIASELNYVAIEKQRLLIELENSNSEKTEYANRKREYENYCNEADRRLQMMFISRIHSMDSICEFYFNYQSNVKLGKSIRPLVEEILEEFKTESLYAEIVSYVNTNFNGLYDAFLQDMGDYVKNEDLLLFLYSAIGLSSGTIVMLLEAGEKKSIYNRSARLRNKIKDFSFINEAKYLEVLNRK